MNDELAIGNTFKVTTVRYIRAESMAAAESLYLDGLTPDSHSITVECVVCEREFDEERHFNNGACSDCIQAELAEDSAGAIACPLGDGGFDCSPFCPSCAGAQFINEMPELWTVETVIKCDECNCPMLPNVSTWDSDGCAWICATPDCAANTVSELEPEDLIAVGVPAWVAYWVAGVVDGNQDSAGA
jgi:hypothetical protein